MTDNPAKYPTHDFTSPLNRDFKLSGTFGELRNNHFHGGLDIKSKTGTDGEPIYTVGEGFISRVKVEASGYGNVLYIDHPNGFTTVYAHLQRFSPNIEEYVRAKQYESESFEIDLNLDPALFPLNQGDQIGFMGNTGASGGTHLHFEVRHTANQTPINPLHFGYQVIDNLPPIVQQLIVYELDSTDQVLNQKVLTPRKLATGKYGFDKPLEFGSPKLAFAVRTYDGQDGTSNQNGIYGIECKIDNEPTFAFQLDEIPFDQTRYLNAHIDYQQKSKVGTFFHRCHALEGNKLPIYYLGEERGKVYVNSEIPRNVGLAISDFKGNKSTLDFIVQKNTAFLPIPSPLYLKGQTGLPQEITIMTQNGIQVVWPKGAFYEKTSLQIQQDEIITGNAYSHHYDISPDNAPIHLYSDILIEGLNVPKEMIDKAFIARCSANGSVVNCGGKWVGNNLVTSVRQLGTYAIMADTIAPKVSVVHFGSKMTGWSRMAFKISDNFPAKEKARGLRFNAYVDGKWVLFTHDAKSATITHQFDGTIQPGTHQLLVEVVDDRGNKGIWEGSFVL